VPIESAFGSAQGARVLRIPELKMKKSSGEREYRIIWGFYSGGIGVVVGGWMDGWRKSLKNFASRFGFVFLLLILSVAVLKSQVAGCILFFKIRVCDFGIFGVAVNHLLSSDRRWKK
jgi:hypothetical protein